MTREEAIEVYNGLINQKIKEAFEFFVPELRESEDERTRRAIIHLLEVASEAYLIEATGLKKEQFLAYLEKQKINTEGDFGRGYDCGYEACLNSHGAEWLEKQKDNQYFVGYAKGYSDGQLNPKQKEQKHPDGCFTCDEYKKGYEEGRRNGFTAGYNKAMKEVEQKEQKPVDNEKVQMTEFEQSVYDLCPVLGIEEAKATASELLELAKKTLLKTGKVVLASNYPEGCSFEDGFHLGYNEGFNAKQEQKPAEWSEVELMFRGEKVKVKRPFFRDDNGRGYSTTEQDDEVTWNALRAWAESHGHTPFELYPREEWSDEDEKMRDNIICILHKDVTYMPPTGLNSCTGSGNAFYTHQTEIDWLKSLRPSWRPSEEQMKTLQCAIVFMEIHKASDYDITPLKSLYRQLKKLM